MALVPLNAIGKRMVMFKASPEFLLQLVMIPDEGIRVNDEVIKPVGDHIPPGSTISKCTVNSQGQVCFIVENDAFDMQFGDPPMWNPAFNVEPVNLPEEQIVEQGSTEPSK